MMEKTALPTPERTKIEQKPFEATRASYQTAFASYLASKWDENTLGANPLGHPDTKLASLGKEGLTNGIHELDTTKITPDELRQVVRVLDAMYADAADFQKWLDTTHTEIPIESWLNAKNPSVAFRGKEWWISPDGKMDRLTELTKQVHANKEIYAVIDPNFPVSKKLGEMIHNNLELYPHIDGTVDHADLAAETVVVHGALFPGAIHIERNDNGSSTVAITGGDRAQGYGLRGQMIDWLVTSTAASPEHQHALIDEFLKLHPSEKDKRGLAMHVLYRSILETPWFMKNGKTAEAQNLTNLTYDILNGNGVWTGVNTQLSK